VNDQHITAIATIVQDILLFLSACLVGWYLWETRKMCKAAEAQVEAQIMPAIVVRPGGDRDLALVNAGKGPALHIKLSQTERGSRGKRDLDRLVDEIGFVEPGAPAWPTGIRTQGAGINVLNGRSLQCEYTSLSGRTYWTVVDFDKFDNSRLIATRFYPEG
jgi:hypothetical protein